MTYKPRAEAPRAKTYKFDLKIHKDSCYSTQSESTDDSVSDNSLFSLPSTSDSVNSLSSHGARKNSSAATTPPDPASCLDYLKRREVFLYKMMNDPSHKAMLYFLEVLMNSETPLTVEQLAARLTNKSFSAEMREACGGGSSEALKNFLEKYPSLFTIKPSGLVSAVAIDMPGFDEMSETSIDLENCLSPSTTSRASVSVGPMPSESQRSAEKKGTSSSTQVDTTAVSSTVDKSSDSGETEAVKFFQQRLSRREERWVPIKSLAGHLSQASPEVRAVVGPQLEFRGFLLKHPHVFEVQGDLVGLKDPFTATCLSRRPKSFMTGANSSSSTNLSTLNHAKLPAQKVSRPKSLIMLSQASNGGFNNFRSQPTRGLCNAPTGSECYLMNQDRFGGGGGGYSECTPLTLSGKPIGSLSADAGRFQAP
ncbi:unnamed protein product, partial [Dibothriocephalus latus]